MKAGLLVAFLLWQAAAANELPRAQPNDMRYERTLSVPTRGGQACAVLDGEVFSHAAASLADMRIFSTAKNGVAQEVPYAVTESGAATEETQAAQVLNLSGADGRISFDLEMPRRAYTNVKLELDPAVRNFVATAVVSGSNELRGGVEAALGLFSLFDLAGRQLGRDTTLSLTESAFRYLHVVLSVANVSGAKAGSAARFGAGMVVGAEVPPGREAQILYTAVAETSSIATVGAVSRATFELPVRVPVERVSLVLAPGFKGNFSRVVRVTALSEAKTGADTRTMLPEVVTGTILRVHAREAGREIRSEQLEFPAVLGANLQGAAKVEVAIENGGEQALPIAAVRLEMRHREVCLDSAATGMGQLKLLYGDPGLEGPVYEYERGFAPSEKTVAAQLGPEMLNASYRAPVGATRLLGERRRRLLWIGLGAVLFALGAMVLRWPPRDGASG